MTAAFDARMGGDEFMVIVHGPRDEVERTAPRILSSAEEPYDVQGDRFTVEASVGVAVVITKMDDTQC